MKIPLDFSTSVGNCVSEHVPIGFAVSVGKCADRPGSLTVMRVGMCAIPSVNVAGTVIVLQLLKKYRRVPFCRYSRQWVWQNIIIFLQLSVQYRWVTSCQYCSRWNCQSFASFVCIACLSSTQKLELQTYSTHNIITRANNYKINISCSKILSIILHHKNKALQHI